MKMCSYKVYMYIILVTVCFIEQIGDDSYTNCKVQVACEFPAPPPTLK